MGLVDLVGKRDKLRSGAHSNQPRAIFVAHIRLAKSKARISLNCADKSIIILDGKSNIAHLTVTLRSNFTNPVNLGPCLFVTS